MDEEGTQDQWTFTRWASLACEVVKSRAEFHKLAKGKKKLYETEWKLVKGSEPSHTQKLVTFFKKLQVNFHLWALVSPLITKANSKSWTRKKRYRQELFLAIATSFHSTNETHSKREHYWCGGWDCVTVAEMNRRGSFGRGKVPAIPENRGFQKMEIQFFFSTENNSISTSFGKKLVTLKWPQKCQNSLIMYVFEGKKLNFIFFMSLFWGIAEGPHSWTRALVTSTQPEYTKVIRLYTPR